MAVRSVFAEFGLKNTIQIISKEIQDIYAMDDVPWIIGYSGGKDSTACVQLVWNALAGLPTKQRHKEVHVISTDTRVENPIVSQWVSRSLESMRRMAKMERIPIQPHQLKPEISDSFWVNLLGKGYPSPRHMFRWCTERMKIRPANTFISKIVQTKGEAILILGTRKQESIARARTMARHAQKQLRERLTPNASLHGSLIYTPIEDWSNDDVWTFLNQVPNPWDYPNEYLLGMYAGATEGGECPLVIESNTPSCGDSRFGCWVCTLVDKDKSMSAMIQNDAEKEWMLPLLDLRNELDMRDQPGDKSGDGLRRDRERRDFRRMDGRLHMFVQDKDKDESKKSRKGEELDKDPRRALVHGPYVQAWRERFLRKLLLAQVHVQTHGGETNRDFEIISLPELEAIRRIWVVEKHEIEDSLPRIFKDVTGEEYPGVPLDDQCPLDHEVLALLLETCEALKVEGEDVAIRYGLLREMLSVESGFRTSRRRAGLFEALEKAIGRHLFWSEQDAVAWAKMRRDSERAFKGVNQTMQDMALVLSPDPEDEDGDASLGSGLPEAFRDY